MKFKAKLNMKFLTDAEEEDHNENYLTMDSRISTNIKIVSRIKNKPTRKIKKNRRHKKFETEDEE